MLLCSAWGDCRQEQRKAEYEERQAARKARDDTGKPAKFEMEVSSGAAGVVVGVAAAGIVRYAEEGKQHTRGV